MQKDTRYRPGDRHKIVKCPLHLLGCHKTMRSHNVKPHIEGFHQRKKAKKVQCQWCLKFFHPRSKPHACYLTNTKPNKAETLWKPKMIGRRRLQSLGGAETLR